MKKIWLLLAVLLLFPVSADAVPVTLPTITQHPENILELLPLGSPMAEFRAEFSATATGSAPLIYQPKSRITLTQINRAM